MLRSFGWRLPPAFGLLTDQGFNLKHSLLVTCVGMLSCGLVWADTGAPVPATADPGHTRAASAPRFAIWEIQVRGNTLLDGTIIERTLTPFLGPDGHLDKVQDAASALERAYREAGYPTVLVNIPEQDVVAGLVQLEVVEGKVSRVRVTGSRYHLLSEIKSKVDSVQPGQPMHIPSFQADLNTLNSTSNDLRVTPVLKPGRTPGTVEVDLRVKDELPLHGSLELNNHNSLDTTDTRMSASISYDNLWQQHHSISLQYQDAPEQPGESRVLASTYILPIIDNVSRLAAYAVSSDSEVSTVGDLSVVGAGNILGVRLVRALGASSGYVHSLSVGMDYKDFDESVRMQGADADRTPIQYASLAGIYNGTVISEKTTTRLGFSLNMGLREMLGGSDFEAFNRKRNDAKPNFAYIQSSVKHQYRLASGWRINGRGKIQWADSPLISNEQFSAGGATTVRGYYESQTLGDDGVVASLELESPDWLASGSELRLRGFVDGGWLRIQDPLPSQDGESAVAGMGVGADYKLGKWLTFVSDAAVALREATDIDEGDLRIHAAVVLDF